MGGGVTKLSLRNLLFTMHDSLYLPYTTAFYTHFPFCFLNINSSRIHSDLPQGLSTERNVMGAHAAVRLADSAKQTTSAVRRRGSVTLPSCATGRVVGAQPIKSAEPTISAVEPLGHATGRNIATEKDQNVRGTSCSEKALFAVTLRRVCCIFGGWRHRQHPPASTSATGKRGDVSKTTA